MSTFRRALVLGLVLLAIFARGLAGGGGSGGGVVILPLGRNGGCSGQQQPRATFPIADFRDGVVALLPAGMENSAVQVSIGGEPSTSVSFAVSNGDLLMDGNTLDAIYRSGVHVLDITLASANGLMLRMRFQMSADGSALLAVF